MTDLTPVVHLDARRPLDAHTLRVAAEFVAKMGQAAEAELSNLEEPAEDEQVEAGRAWGLHDACVALYEWSQELNAKQLGPEVECRLQAVIRNAQAALDGDLPAGAAVDGIAALASAAREHIGGGR